MMCYYLNIQFQGQRVKLAKIPTERSKIPCVLYTRLARKQHSFGLWIWKDPVISWATVGHLWRRHTRHIKWPHGPRYMEQSPSWAANRFAASQEIPRILWNPRFITTFTSTRHLSLSWASSIQSTLPHPTSWRSFLILPSHLPLISQVVTFLQVSPPKPCI